MWDSIMIILDNCNDNDKFEFEKLDPPLKNLNKHPLMLMAKSGIYFLILLLNVSYRSIVKRG